MNSPALRRLALTCLLAAPLLWLIGPRWPGGHDRLLCGDTWSERDTFPDRPTCEIAMHAAKEQCVCEDVRGTWSPFYYMVLIPLIAVHGLLFLFPRTIAGAVAVLAVVAVVIFVLPLGLLVVLATGMHLPRIVGGLLGSMAIAWPQLVLFPSVLQIGATKLIPWEVVDWSFTISVATWAILGIPFGAATQRLRSHWFVLALAVGYVAIVTIGLVEIVPRFGGTFHLEFP